MARIIDIFKYIEEFAPTENRCEWDNDGLQVCSDEYKSTDKVLLCLDVTNGAIEAAKMMGAGLIVSHHPLIFSPINAINKSVPEARLALKLLENGISHISAHTRLDRASGGVNERLAELMGISDMTRFGEDDIGIIGTVEATDCKSLALFAKKCLGAPSVAFTLGDKPITKLAVVCGSGKDFLESALSVGADALLTGDVSYTAFMTAERLGIALIDAGHFYTEAPILKVLSDKLCERFPELDTSVYYEPIAEEV